MCEATVWRAESALSCMSDVSPRSMQASAKDRPLIPVLDPSESSTSSLYNRNKSFWESGCIVAVEWTKESMAENSGKESSPSPLASKVSKSSARRSVLRSSCSSAACGSIGWRGREDSDAISVIRWHFAYVYYNQKKGIYVDATAT